MIYRFGPFDLDQDLFELRRSGQPVPIEPKVLGLLMLLVQERHRAVDKRELLAKNWPDAVVGEASLTRAVMEARKALGDEAHEVIVTVRGRGFRFAAPVDQLEAGASPAAVTTLVGRTAALTTLSARLIAGSEGSGSTVWITGEAGIGKSALADEVARMARDRGAKVLRARCHDELRGKRSGTIPPTGSLPPSSAPSSPKYWLWTQVARACVDALPDATLHDLRSFTTEDFSTTSTKNDFGRYDAFVRDLRAASSRAPLVVILEDLQWADDASVTMLQFVARELSGSRVMLVATYRDTPPLAGSRGEAMTRAVHASGGVSIPLRPLERDDVAELLERTTGSAARPESVAWLHGKSGGNPLYLRELLQAKGAAIIAREHSNATSLSTDLTDGLRKSIERHLEALSKPCRETLAHAALLGQSFDFATVTTISGLPGDAVLDRLGEAVQARLVEKSATGTYAFRHALVRSVLSRGLSATARANAHASIAKVLDEHWGAAADAHAEQLAHHYVRALPHGDPRRAFDTSLRAAELSMTRGDHARAAAHYQHAIEALRHLRGEEARGVAVHLALARASEKRSAERAREAYLDAAVLASALHVAEPLAEAALGFAATSPPADAKRALLEQAKTALAKATGARANELRSAIDAALAG